MSTAVSKDSVDRVRATLERKIAACQERVALKVYNFIVSADVDYTPGPNLGAARTPEWSGAFRSSWRISSGSVDGSHEVSPSRRKYQGVVFKGSGTKSDLNHADYRIPIFISNSVRDAKGRSYAGQIENLGTYHHQEPWKIAANALNVIRHLSIY